MPSITGIAHVELSVRDLDTSQAWYENMLGLKTVFNDRDDRYSISARALRDPSSGVVLALTQHDGNGGEEFNPRRAGLDHLSFGVADRNELESWHRHLTERGADPSEIADWSHGTSMTVRDPDGIAIELYVRGPVQA
jgi:catechol-2,3-dioxygenase